eukprot:5573282-Pleurochrysis_carterae.AAC.13
MRRPDAHRPGGRLPPLPPASLSDSLKPDSISSFLIFLHSALLTLSHSFEIAQHFTMQDNNNSQDTDTISPPFLDSSQRYLREWLDDLATWLPAQHSNYFPSS